MAIALGESHRSRVRVRTTRDIGFLITGVVAIASFLVALWFINKVDSRNSFIALAVFVVTALAALAFGYRKRPYLAFIVPAVAIYTMFVMFPAVEAVQSL